MNAVFIGSTALDLPEYRKAAIEVCNRLGMRPVAMEFFEATGAGATIASKRKVELADVYVGIFAHRLGYTEEGHTKAVIEEEFDRAGELGIERLCFLVDPHVEWPPDAIDFANYERLKAFKGRLDKTVVRAMFTGVGDFEAKLTHALVEWRERSTGLPRKKSPSGPAATLRFAGAKPPRPHLLLGREAELEVIRNRIGARDASTRRLVTVIRGWPGVGKSSVMAELAHDDATNAAFNDGILWTAVGEEPHLIDALGLWISRLGGRPTPKPRSLRESVEELKVLLQNKRVLLLVDDVWSAETAAAFRVAELPASIVYSTRFQGVAREVAPTADDILRLTTLDPDYTFRLFQQLAPSATKAFETEVRSLASILEGLPLSIRVAARLLETEFSLGWGISDLLHDLAEGGRLLRERAPSDRFDAESGRIPSVEAILARSTDQLDPVTRHRFARLGSFAARPAMFGLEDLRAVWEVEDAKPPARLLADRGLLEPIPGTGYFQMHALLAAHARAISTETVELEELNP